MEKPKLPRSGPLFDAVNDMYLRENLYDKTRTTKEVLDAIAKKYKIPVEAIKDVLPHANSAFEGGPLLPPAEEVYLKNAPGVGKARAAQANARSEAMAAAEAWERQKGYKRNYTTLEEYRRAMLGADNPAWNARDMTKLNPTVKSIRDADLEEFIKAQSSKPIDVSEVKSRSLKPRISGLVGPAIAAGEVLAGEDDIGKMAAGLAGSEILGTLAAAVPGGAVTKGIVRGTGAVAGYPLGQMAYEKLAPETVKKALKLSPEERLKIKNMLSEIKNKVF